MESRVSFNFFFFVEPESCFSDGTGIPAACSVEPLSAQHGGAEVSLF